MKNSLCHVTLRVLFVHHLTPLSPESVAPGPQLIVGVSSEPDRIPECQRVRLWVVFHGLERLPFANPPEPKVVYIPLFGGREQIDLVNLGGSHGGGDPLLLDELFIGRDPLAPVDGTASLEDGIEAVLTGTAVRQSATEHRVVSVEQMRKKVFG